MRVFFFFLVCICLGKSITAQNNSELRRDEKYKCATTMSLTFFPYSVGIQPGFQLRLGRKFEFISEAAISIGSGGNNQYDEMHFFKLSAEVKYFPRKAFAGSYFSFQTGYVQRKFQAKDSGWYWRDGNINRTGYSNADIKSPVIFSNLKMGREIKVKGNFFLDLFVGVGARYIHTSYDAKNAYPLGPLTTPRDNIFELAGYSWENEGDQIKFQATAGLRLGVRF